MTAANLAHRFLWNPAAVDQLLADEQVANPAAAGEVLWALTDHLGSVRDVVGSNGARRIHKNFDSFGNVLGESHYNSSGTLVTSGAGYVDTAFGFTGRLLDDETGLQNNLHRWYDASVGRWLSEDPIGFAAGDPNLYRYVGNMPAMYVDPSGLEEQSGWFLVNPFSWWYGDPRDHKRRDDEIRDRAMREAQRDLATNFDRGMERLRDVQSEQCRTAVGDATGLANVGVNFNAAAIGGGFVRPSGAGGGSMRGGQLAKAGRGAEEAVSGAVGIPINRGRGIDIIPGSGVGGYRIPDLRVFGEGRSVAVRGSIIEIKDTTRLYCSKQIADLADYASQNGLTLEIFTNGRVPQSGRLPGYINRGIVKILPIPE